MKLWFFLCKHYGRGRSGDCDRYCEEDRSIADFNADTDQTGICHHATNDRECAGISNCCTTHYSKMQTKHELV